MIRRCCCCFFSSAHQQRFIEVKHESMNPSGKQTRPGSFNVSLRVAVMLLMCSVNDTDSALYRIKSSSKHIRSQSHVLVVHAPLVSFEARRNKKNISLALVSISCSLCTTSFKNRKAARCPLHDSLDVLYIIITALQIGLMEKGKKKNLQLLRKSRFHFNSMNRIKNTVSVFSA